MTLAPWSSPNHPKSATQQNHQMSFNLFPTNWIRSPTTPVPKRDRRKVLFRQGITPVMARGCNGKNSAGTWYCLIVFGMASAVIPAVIFTTSNLQGTHLPLPQPPPAPGGSATKSERSLEFPIMEASWVSRVDRGATGRQLQNEVRRSIYISAILWCHVVVTISTILSSFFLKRSRLPTSSPVTWIGATGSAYTSMNLVVVWHARSRIFASQAHPNLKGPIEPKQSKYMSKPCWKGNLW